MTTKRKILIGATALAMFAGVAAVTVSADAATAPVLFTGVYYNSPGTDTRTNTSLNQEWFRLKNQTASPLALKGWTVRDNQSHVYTFGVYTLPAHSSVIVHTGKGTNAKPNVWDRYWGSANYIWNNDGDKATLKNNAAKVIDTCSWGNTGSSTGC